MKQIIVTFLSLSVLMLSCQNNDDVQAEETHIEEESKSADDAFAEIIELESNVIGSNDAVSNSKLLELKRACEAFDKAYYNDKRVETVMQKGIRASVSLKNYADAITMMDKVIKDYGTEKKMPGLLFQKAFIYSESNWLGEADKIYTKIIKRYPNDPLAEQSKAAQELLFLTPEELTAKFSGK